MMKKPLQEHVAILKHIAMRAGEIMMKRFDGRYQIYDKSDGTRVTDVDLEISEVIREFLSREFPEAVLFSEESSSSEFVPGKPHLIIDELDGTSAYIEKRLGFSHQAAFYDPTEGLTFGLIYHPWNNTLITATKGEGAILEIGQDARSVPPPPHPTLEQFRYAHPYRYRGKKYRRLLDQIGADQQKVVLTDSTRTFQLALGQVDATIMLMHRIPEWDWAAEKVIVEELGYYHGYLNGRPALFGEEPPENNPGYLICPLPFEQTLRSRVLEALPDQKVSDH